MVWNLVAASVLALSLAGCSLGIARDGSSPQREFKAPVNLEDAYATAVRQANACLRSTDDAYRVLSRRDDGGQAGVVRVLAPYTDNEMARVELKAAGPKHTDTRIVMWGKGAWDAAAMRAMQDAIVYGMVSCASYMPLNSRPLERPQE